MAPPSSTICIIPARGGSKRIPRKNIRPFLGRPIIAYAIEAAKNSRCFDEVMVSTDDEEIASIAREYGASVPFMRSAATADDHSNFTDALTEVLERYRELGRNFELCCSIFPTAVLTQPEHLRIGHEKLKADPELYAVVPVLHFGYPIQRALKIDAERLHMIQPENYFVRTQDMEKAYHDSGQWYWMRADKISGKLRLLAPTSAPLVISEMDAQDIDNETDWWLAEVKYQTRAQAR